MINIIIITIIIIIIIIIITLITLIIIIIIIIVIVIVIIIIIIIVIIIYMINRLKIEVPLRRFDHYDSLLRDNKKSGIKCQQVCPLTVIRSAGLNNVT